MTYNLFSDSCCSFCLKPKTSIRIIITALEKPPFQLLMSNLFHKFALRLSGTRCVCYSVVRNVSFVCLSCKSQPLMSAVFPVTDKVKVRADGGQDNIFAVEACWWLTCQSVSLESWCLVGISSQRWTAFQLNVPQMFHLKVPGWNLCHTRSQMDGGC